MEEFKPFIVKIPVNYIPSENQRLSGGRKKHLTPVALQFKTDVFNSLLPLGNEEFGQNYPYLDGNYQLDCEYHFVLNQSMFRRDTDNLVKMFQDSLFDWLELNDSLIVRIEAIKFYAPSSPNEFIIAKIQPSQVNISIYEEKFRSSSNQISQE